MDSKGVEVGFLEYESPNLNFVESEGLKKMIRVTPRSLDYLPRLCWQLPLLSGFSQWLF